MASKNSILVYDLWKQAYAKSDESELLYERLKELLLNYSSDNQQWWQPKIREQSMESTKDILEKIDKMKKTTEIKQFIKKYLENYCVQSKQPTK